MRLLVDTHTHTTLSGHAYSTLLENIEFAASKGLEGIAVTDHGEKITGAQPNFALFIPNTFPREYKGIRIVRGVEADIEDYEGHIDIQEKYLNVLDFVIASFHQVVLKPGSREQDTQAFLGAIANPHVDVIGHPGNPAYPIDTEEVVKALARHNKIMEVNSHSFGFRTGSGPICRELIRLCKKHGVRITVGSDAHVCFRVGMFDPALIALVEEGFPEEMVISRTIDSFEEYLKERAARLQARV